MLFPTDYLDGRERFRALASRTDFVLESYEHPVEKGPQGETLSCDVARFGPSDAKRIILISSGTHGVEGFC
jgi:hypothetical protein